MTQLRYERELSIDIWISISNVQRNKKIHVETQGAWDLLVLHLGESMDLGNTFWQAHFGKNRKTYLGRGLNKPSTEVRFFDFGKMRLPKSVTQVHGFTHMSCFLLFIQNYAWLMTTNTNNHGLWYKSRDSI